MEKAFSSLRLTSTYKHLQRFTEKLSSLRLVSVTLANYCVCAVKCATKFSVSIRAWVIIMNIYWVHVG